MKTNSKKRGGLRKFNALVRLLNKRMTRSHRFMLAQSRHNAIGRTLDVYKHRFSTDQLEYMIRVWAKNQKALNRVGKRWKLI